MSKIEKKLETEKIKVEELKLELYSLIDKIKSEEKLEIGKTFLLKKDVNISGVIKLKKGETLEIADIIEGKGSGTSIIKCILSSQEEIELSKGVFIMYICEEIRVEQDKKRKKEKILRKEIEKEENRLKKIKGNGNLEEEIEDVKSKLHTIIQIFTRFRKTRKKQKKRKNNLSN